MVRKADEPDPALLKVACSRLVLAKPVRLVVLAPIELNAEQPFRTVEVEDVRPDGMLTPELKAGDLPGAEKVPEQSLCRSLLLAQHAALRRRGLRPDSPIATLQWPHGKSPHLTSPAVGEEPEVS